ncbi:hypothetical protein [Specibacter cremeus]|uniref:hypothetical protein n=1 Tax=Specibacter cremeus TaxID=1629051 RepID=UPI000F78C700|nr:hypothetical protein [Specibacter cremeus]
MNGTQSLVMTTPCNTLNVPIMLTNTLITPDAAAIVSGTQGCLGSNGDDEAWVHAFLSHPIAYSRVNTTFTLTNEAGTIEFTSTSPAN